MEWQLAEIHRVVGGTLHGDPQTRIRGVRSLEQAGPEHLSFVRGARHMTAAHSSRAGALIVPASDAWQRPVIEVADPELALIQVLSMISARQLAGRGGVHPRASVSPRAEVDLGVVIEAHAVICDHARIGRGAIIGAGCVVGPRSVIGAGSRLYGNVTIYHDVQLGERVIVHGATVIGADGFGYVQRGGKAVKIPHVGGVVIEDDVELGALVTVDRGTLDSTIIRRGAKIDDHCHIAHNCDVGEGVLMAGCSMLAGSVRVGKGTVFAGSCGVSDNLVLGDGVRVGASSSVLSDVPAGESVLGFPASKAPNMLKALAVVPRLPQMRRTLQRIVERLGLSEDGPDAR